MAAAVATECAVRRIVAISASRSPPRRHPATRSRRATILATGSSCGMSACGARCAICVGGLWPCDDLPAFGRATAGAGSRQGLADEGGGELLEVTAGGVGGVAQGALPGEHCQPVNRGPDGVLDPGAAPPAEHTGVGQFVEDGAKLIQGQGVLPVPRPERRRRADGAGRTRWRTALAPRGRTPGTPGRSRAAGRRAAAASPYLPRTRPVPAAMRAASSRMAAVQTAARSSSRSAKCR